MGQLSPFRRVSKIALGAWSAFLWRRLRPTMISRTGLPLTLLSLSDWDIFSEIWVSGEYDEPILRALNKARPNEPVRIVDLGANVGFFSLRCIEVRNRNNPGQPLDIVAVEGVPRTFRTLRRNLAAQRGNVSLSLHQGLMGERSGIAHIHDNSYAGANAVVSADGKTSILPFCGAHAVRSTYLDLESILPPDIQIDLLKCDIEGSESIFLTTYPQILARTRLLVIEFHPLHCDIGECRRSLAASGLERERIFRTSPNMILEMYANGWGKHVRSR
jgi:FkbM family methyltransferase